MIIYGRKDFYITSINKDGIQTDQNLSFEILN